MRQSRFQALAGRYALRVFLFGWLCLAGGPARAGEILTPALAATHIGDVVTVEFLVKDTGSNPEGYRELYSEESWQVEGCFVGRFPTNTAAAQLRRLGIRNFEAYFNGKVVRVTGTVTALDFSDTSIHPCIVVDSYAGIREAYRHAMEEKLYDSVEYVHGGKKKAYAATNAREYFAELSEAYFGKNDYFPFTREDLRKHDPVGFKLMQDVWE